MARRVTRRNPRESVQPRAAQDVQQYCLRLIVRVMRRRNQRGAHAFARALEERIAQAARRRLERL